MTAHVDFPKILVIEDFPVMRDTLRDRLSQLPAEVETCPDAGEAFERPRNPPTPPWKIVILDKLLPPCGGQTAADLGIALLRAHRLVAPGTPVIVFTGYESFPDCVNAMKAGAYDYIAKSDGGVPAL